MELVEFYKQKVPLLADILNYYNKSEQYNLIKYLSVIGLNNVLDTLPQAVWSQAQKNGTFSKLFSDEAKKQAKKAAESKARDKQSQPNQNQRIPQSIDDFQSQNYRNEPIEILEDPLELLNQPFPSTNLRNIQNNFQNIASSSENQAHLGPKQGVYQNYLSPQHGINKSVKSSYEQLELQHEIKYLKEKLEQLNNKISIENSKRNQSDCYEDNYYDNTNQNRRDDVELDNYYNQQVRQPTKQLRSSKQRYQSPSSKNQIAQKITQSPPPDIKQVLKSRSPQHHRQKPPHLDDNQIKQILQRDVQQGNNYGGSYGKSSNYKPSGVTNSKKALKKLNNPNDFRSPSSQNQSNRDLLIVQQKLFSSDAFNHLQFQGSNNQSLGQQQASIPRQQLNPQQKNQQQGTAIWQAKGNNSSDSKNKISPNQQNLNQQKATKVNPHQRQKDYYQSVAYRSKEENKVHTLPKSLKNVTSKIKDEIQKHKEQYRHSKEEGRAGVFDQFDQQDAQDQGYQYEDQNEYNQYQDQQQQQQFQGQNQIKNQQQNFNRDPNILQQNQLYQQEQIQQIQQQIPLQQQQLPLQQQNHQYQQISGQYAINYDIDPTQVQSHQVRHHGSTETYPNELVQYLSVDSRQTQSNDFNEFQQNQKSPVVQMQQQRQQGFNFQNQISPNGTQDPQYLMHMMQQNQQLNPNLISSQISLQQQQQQYQHPQPQSNLEQYQKSYNNNNFGESLYQSLEKKNRNFNQLNPYIQGSTQFNHTPQQSGTHQNQGSYPQSQYNTYNSNPQASQNFRQSQNNQLQQTHQNPVEFANSFLSSPLIKHLNSDQNLFTSNNIQALAMNNYNPYLNTSNTILTSQNRDGKQSKLFGETGNINQGQLYSMSPQMNNFSPPGYDQKQSQIIGSNSIYIQNQAQGINQGMPNQYQINNNSQNTDNNSSNNNILQSNNENLVHSWVKGSSSGHSNTANNIQNPIGNTSNSSNRHQLKAGSTGSNPLIGSQLTVSKNIESQSPGKGAIEDEIQNVASPQFMNNNPVEQSVNTFGNQDDQDLAQNINSYRLQDDQPKYFIGEKKGSLKQKDQQVQNNPVKEGASRKGSQTSDQNQNISPQAVPQSYQQRQNATIIDQQQEVYSEEEPDDDQHDVKRSSQNGYMKQSDSQTAKFREKFENEDDDFNDQNQNIKYKQSQIQNQGISSSSEENQQNNNEDGEQFNKSEEDNYQNKQEDFESNQQEYQDDENQEEVNDNQKIDDNQDNYDEENDNEHNQDENSNLSGEEAQYAEQEEEEENDENDEEEEDQDESNQ
ncbi:hypothetical protein TTHERM_00189090 (macronuclear) [Tetrahymena thermophila SB210]|uniref:Uncharacterized protein n=1 Tax=Tetrahymena thermophila (strain SB210) TaxID=312017 RepID=I7MJH2_TETTS|nr:hypothetical protein TTHERM_00189090 [Tetrahymena thermophila SB210]EAR96340.2 hypothetical protein TTHERM_00189090 [Tetrahymena thermophila SB210]|eukprot:XP_001016585.2 hypothetical protein TTHERM_00189090 [Tetrahymena thermophila SB210]